VLLREKRGGDEYPVIICYNLIALNISPLTLSDLYYKISDNIGGGYATIDSKPNK
jgi:hypothetical protein